MMIVWALYPLLFLYNMHFTLHVNEFSKAHLPNRSTALHTGSKFLFGTFPADRTKNLQILDFSRAFLLFLAILWGRVGIISN